MLARGIWNTTRSSLGLQERPVVAWIRKGRSRRLVGRTWLVLLLHHWRVVMRHRAVKVLLLPPPPPPLQLLPPLSVVSAVDGALLRSRMVPSAAHLLMVPSPLLATVSPILSPSSCCCYCGRYSPRRIVYPPHRLWRPQSVGS